MITGLTLDFLAILIGAFGMLSLLILLFGRQAQIAPYAEPFDAEADGQSATQDAEAPFVAMPGHLRTNAEMVAWMTQELPTLAEGATPKPQRN
ncbi:hypothetical protein [Microvirga sp. P5_D2]